MIKVIIAGGRAFDNYPLLKEKCDFYIGKHKAEIVCGMAKGADLLGMRYATDRHLTVHKFLADWNGLGKKAGYVRNEQMAKFADCLIAFWDGKSKGTKHMIDLARRYGLKVKIVNY